MCDVLERAAQASLRAGSPVSAVGYLSRALAEPPPPQRRAHLLAELGRAEVLTDGHAAVRHLTEALELTDDPRARDALAVVLARVLLYTGRPQESLDLILRTKRALGGDSEDLRQMMDALTLIVPLYGVGETATARSSRATVGCLCAPAWARSCSPPPRRANGRSPAARRMLVRTWRWLL